MIKKHKDGETSGTSEKSEKKAQKSKSEEANKAFANDYTTTTPETENGSGEETGDVSSEKAENGGVESGKDTNAENNPTEADVLKLYLKQTLENSKKQKDEIESLKKQLELTNSQIAQCKEKFDGLVSEYENYRRRTSAEKENLGTEATTKSVKALLPALDNLERAMPFAESNYDSFKKGVEMTLNQLCEAFKSLGVEEIEAQGAEFDPELHDAVMHVDDDSLGESVVTDVFQKGYHIGDKVVRHSVVKVAN